MLEQFRRASNTWAARGLFALLIFSFALWGIGGDMLNRISHVGSVISVSGRDIDMPQVQEAYRRQLAQLTKMLGGQTDPSPEMRRMVLNQTVDQIINEAALGQAVANDGFVVPDDVLREAIYHNRDFLNQNGEFDRARFETLLRNAGYSETRFLELMRTQLAVQQMLGAAGAGAYVPDIVARDIFAYQQEKRTADSIEFAFAAAPDPAPPSEEVLRRWWDNHPDAYSTKEYRRVKAVILSPDTLAADVQVSDEDLHAAYDQHRSEYVVPPKRSVEAILASDETVAQGLAGKWREGATWEAMQEAAKTAGATAVTLDDAARGEFPASELADAVFTATPDSVPDPVKSPLGWYVIKVTKVDEGVDRSFEQVKDELRQNVARERATNMLYDRLNKVEDAIANSNGLNEVPADLGLAAVTGTMDAEGNTKEGEPAPIPGGPPFRTAIAQAAFKTPKNEPPKLNDVPGSGGGTLGYFALIVEDIIPPAREPFEAVREKVLADWTADARRKAQETAAASAMAAIEGGQSVADAATVAGVPVRRTPQVGREGTPPEGVASQIVKPLFDLKPGGATMVETPESFLVVALAEAQPADPATDPVGFSRLKETLDRGVAADVQNTLARALRDRGRPRVNQAALDALIQP